MVVFTAEVFSDGSKNVLCSECGSFVGRLGGDEIRALMLSPYKDLYCFVCDSVGADSVHPALLKHVRVYDRTFNYSAFGITVRGYRKIFGWERFGEKVER